MKILHLSYHHGCKLNLDCVAKLLGHEIETQHAAWNYNIGHARAEEIWNEYKDYYSQFDVIITSDTAPLSRIFLQNNYPGKLIVWVCNRFDYADNASNDCGFPDPEYYALFQSAIGQPNRKIRSYTQFEHEYAKQYRNIDWGDEVIRPFAIEAQSNGLTAFPDGTNKYDVFLIPPYHNDNIMMNLHQKCREHGISTWAGRYTGPGDLVGIKGVIHIPYAWSNFALFENWILGNIYLIPSQNFLLKLQRGGNFFWSPPFNTRYLESSEWYLPKHQQYFEYFDSWEHLKRIATSDLTAKKQAVQSFMKEHNEHSLRQWKKAIEEW